MIIYKINILKSQIFLIVALLFTAFSFAQLYIAPSGNSEEDSSYIYVKDEVLFVTGDIDLTENPEGSKEASIYFRDGGQLIQGDAITSTNKGTGYISILQTDLQSDAWDYAYWSSPVGDPNIAGTGNKNFGALRFFNPQGAKDGDCDCFLGTDSNVNIPTTNLNGEYNPDMRISSRWLYTYTNNIWTRIYNNSDVLPGRGFTMKGLGTTNHDQTYDFRGRPNNGNISTPIYASEDPGGPRNLSLSGNPYPSALDLSAVFYDEDNEEISAFYFWDEDHDIDGHYYVDNKGGYGTWIPGPEGSPDGGDYTAPTFLSYNNDGTPMIGSDNGDGAQYDRRYAPIGQGFMLYGMSDTPENSEITYKNSHRVRKKIGDGSDFRSNDDDSSVTEENVPATGISPNPPDIRKPQLRINTYFNQSHGRQLLLSFLDESTDGYDRGLDGRSPMDSTSDVYFPIEGENQEFAPYVIQTVPYNIKKQIPYTITLELRTRVVVNLVEKVNFNGSIYLYDNVEDTFQEINSPYERSAELNLPAGTYEDRFFITFENSRSTQQVAIENTQNKFLEDVDFFQNNPERQLEISNPVGYKIASANIFELSGKLVYSASNLGDNDRFTFPTGNLSDGIYVVMLTTDDNITVNYKITVYNN